MSSIYSLPDRQRFEHIPLKDFNQPQQNDDTERMERIEHNKTKKKTRKYKWSTYVLGALLLIATILTVVFAGLYVSHKNNSYETPCNGTVLTSIVTITSSIPGPPRTRSQTLPPVTQTMVHYETEISHSTIEITKTSALTTTDTTSITVTQSSEPKRCNNNQQYGGQELHDINGDYDLLLIDAVQQVANKAGLSIDGVDALDVARRSVFLCTTSPSIELVKACVSGFVHVGGGVDCNSSGAYATTPPIPTVKTTVTMTSWSTVKDTASTQS